MTTLADAVSQMLAAGMPDFPPGHPVVNAGRITRYGPKKKAWYRLYEFRANNGQFVVGGDYGSWGEIPSSKIEIDWKGIAQEDRERLQRERAETEVREQAKRAERARFASGRARSQWDNARTAKPANVETYLDRKGVEHVKGLRYFADGTVLVPMIRYDITEAQESAEGYAGPRRLVGLQKIAPDGAKLFNKGMAKDGAACRLGNAPKAGELILIAEGLATGLSASMVLKHKSPVFVAFDAGNMPLVAAILRKLFPASPIMLCADDDAYLESSMNKLLRENYHLAELARVPMTAWKFKGQVRERDAWIAAEIEISADWTADGEGVRGIVGAVKHGERMVTLTRENAGRKAANKAAAAIGNAAVVFPVFSDRTLSAEPEVDKSTDFNDLHQAEGLDAVRAQLVPEIERIELSQALRKLVKEEVGKTRREAKGAKAKGGESEPDKSFDWRGFFERFTLIYPTDTLWDAKLREIVKLSAVKIAFGDRIVKWWLESLDRRTVNLDQMVFEPGTEVPKDCINLYRGMPIKPSDKGSCEKLIELLQYLCGEGDIGEQGETPVTDWVLKWLAYPMQHPGAKMQTAIVMHGPEGTGKNLFFGAIRDIYGEYGTLITQTELEDRFNGWLSRRLFLIANEVISRQELRHHVGRLKNMVTEPVLPIREMFTPIRYESNHAQMVFLTNEQQALQIMPGDRRYMVIYTPAAKSAEVYRAVVAEMADGGVSALYAYLLAYECGEFTEHTKPLLTAAKEALIEMGLNSAQFFQQQLSDGLIYPLTYGPCLTTDLYRAYTTFCARTGERNPRPLNKFIPEFSAMNGVTKSIRDIGDPDAPLTAADAAGRRQAMVFVMGEIPDEIKRDDKALAAHVKKNVSAFRGVLREYLQQDVLRKRDGSGEAEGWRGGYGNDD